jgi:hypothetical protein
MKESPSYQAALGVLRQRRVPASNSEQYQEEVARRDEVYARYQPLFTPTGVEDLTAEEFKSFLYFDNNHHWTGLYRLGWKACEDMQRLRVVLSHLFDGSRPLAERVDEAVKTVPGMGKALATALLVVAFPAECGVWNNTSETSLRALKIWPAFTYGMSLGERYLAVNQVLLELAADLEIDLWELDALHWAALLQDGAQAGPDGGQVTPAEQLFVLEKYLQEFMFTNWERLELSKEWALYAPDGDLASAVEFPTDIGNIDLLAKHREEGRWLVVELKRNQTSDDTVGQVLRYMGWVAEKLAEPGERVEGLIVARASDAKLKYALSQITGVRMQVYRIGFSLADEGSASEPDAAGAT